MSPWENSVLVMGASGFIGSYLAETLVRRGSNVRAMVHYRSGGGLEWFDHSALRDEIEVVAGDITDADRVVHTWTSETYGTTRYVLIDENYPMQGQPLYSASKISAEKIAESFYSSFGLPVVTVRPFNTYGPRQSARAGIPIIATRCLNGEIIKPGNQTPNRDLNSVADTVTNIIAAGDVPSVEGITVNLGSCREISTRDLVRLIAELVGRGIKLVIDGVRIRPKDSEVERLLASNERARAKLGWSPAMPLEEGMKQTINWIERNQHRYRTCIYAI